MTKKPKKKIKNKKIPDLKDNKLNTLTKKFSNKNGEQLKQNKTNRITKTKNFTNKIKQSKRIHFILGIFFGLLATIFFTTRNSGIFFRDLDKIVNIDLLNHFIDEWTNSFPIGLQFLFKEHLLQKNRNLKYSKESFSVGKQLKSQNFTHKYNVAIIPGTISTGIESWGSSWDGDCPAITHFRRRLWGSFYMLKSMMFDKTCWLKHIMLDPITGLDPPGIMLRAVQGFDAADFFIPGYWIWNKILQNLSVLGYNPNNMISASYDWRLTYLDLEIRDGFFSKLKNQIELYRKLNGEKTVLISHSMGSQVMFYFMKWVEAEGKHFGNGGKNWCKNNIKAFINISGSLLGTPKTVALLTSGEMKDTVRLNMIAFYGLEKFFSKKERVDILRTFGGIPSMIPKGGDQIWGNLTHAPDDNLHSITNNSFTTKQDRSFGTFGIIKNKTGETTLLTLNQTIDFMMNNSPTWFKNRTNSNYSFGIAHTKEELEKNNQIQLKWSNPLEVTLPNAPNMEIYCFYGVGKPTERAYSYVTNDDVSDPRVVIDMDLKPPVFFGDGDGTLSLLTHSICHEWKKGSKSRYNPANSSVTIVEIKDNPQWYDIRGGAETADHVDILGCVELNELILKVVSGNGNTIKDKYLSNLNDLVKKLNL